MDPAKILSFWQDIGPKGWYEGSEEIDEACRSFTDTWEKARGGAFRDWLSRPQSALAYMILTDQIPRNIHRGGSEAFATDTLALSGANLAIAAKHDFHIKGPMRQFFYLPYEHAESCQMQSQAVVLFLTRLPEEEGNLLHARAHRDIIRRFGRFPYRNQALGRMTTRPEKQFMDEEGYAGVLKQLSS